MKSKKTLPFGRYYLVIVGIAVLLMATSGTVTAAPKILKAVHFTVLSDIEVDSVNYKKLIDRVNERSKGELKIELIGGPEVIPPGEQMRALGKGVIQILVTPTYHLGVVPEVHVVEVSQITPAQERANGLFDLLCKFHEEKLSVRPLGRMASGVGFRMYSNVKVQKVEDLRGLKFRSNAVYDPFLKKFGVTRVSLPGSELYTAMERGVIQGYPYPVTISQLRLPEVTKYAIDHEWWTANAIYSYINYETWKSLPKDMQDLLTEVAIELENETPALAQERLSAERKRLIDMGMQFIKFPPAEAKKFLQIIDDGTWEGIIQSTPEWGPKLRKLVSGK
jgi:TRAP-type C4-dicarboxylate transport system substrate-binding protein